MRRFLCILLLCSTSLQQHPNVLAALEHPRLFELFEALFSLPLDAPSSSAAPPAGAAASVSSGVHVWTSAYKWLRGVPRFRCTGFHFDSVYMRGSTPLYSLWVPIGDLDAAHGNLVVAPGSHRSEQFARLREEYGRSSVGATGNGTTSGWINVSEYTQDSVQVRSAAKLRLQELVRVRCSQTLCVLVCFVSG